VSEGERRVSDLDRWVPKWTPFFTLHILGSLLRNRFRLALVDPTDRYLRAWKPVPSCLQFDQQRVLSRFFSLLLPLPTAAFSTIMAKRKVTAEEPLARAESNGYKKGAHREEDSTRDGKRHIDKTQEGSKCGIGPLCPVRDQYLTAVAKIGADKPHTRWTLSKMQNDSLQQGLPIPDEASARQHCLRKGVDSPDLVTAKGFPPLSYRYEP
jgi:hypothetical protein